MRPKCLVAILILLALALPSSPAHAGGVVSVCDESHLKAALSGGGTVTFTCSGTILLTSPITISTNTTIDGGGQPVVISGNGKVRVFTVNQGIELSLNRLTIADGRSPLGGGGIFNDGGTVKVNNCTFSGNKAPSALDGGGAISSRYGTVTVSNTTFYNNSASLGGAIFGGLATITVTNCTFAGDTTPYGGDTIYNVECINCTSGSVLLKNSIFADDGLYFSCTGPSITDGGGNLSYSDFSCPGIHLNALLGPLQNNNGPTETMALGPGSPAIDAANDATCAASPVNNLDQRGVTRPQGAHCDIGAVEMQPQLGISPSSLPGGAMGGAYSQALTAISGGLPQPPYKFSVQSGTLPTGLTLSSDGLLSGKLVAPGSYSFQVYVEDSATWKNQGTANYTITVTGTNHQPTFTPGGNVTVPNTAAPYNAVWATNISAGGPEDVGQTLTFHISNDNIALFSEQPVLAADGRLSFTSKSNANGVANVAVHLSDDGGTANGGSDTSSTVNFQITVDAAQPGPTFTVTSTDWTTDHFCGVRQCTLREAIQAANNNDDESIIELAPGAVYSILGVDNAPAGPNAQATPNGLPQIVTPITINGHGARITRSTTVPYARFFYVSSLVVMGSLTLNEVHLEQGKVDRSTTDVGGAILNFSTLIVKNSFLARNEAWAGSVVYNYGTASFYNSTLYANSSDWGAIVGYGSLNLYGNTLFNNTGTTYSTLRLESTVNDHATRNLYNNLFLSSSSTPLCDDFTWLHPNMAGNLATDGSCSGFSTTTYAAIKSVPPDYNGGLTQNMAIQAGSSAIDIGNATACQNVNINNRDQRGYARFVDGNGDKVAACDVGAYEYGASGPPAAVLDPDPPVTTIELSPAEPDGANGWYRSPVAVTPGATDASPVIDLRCALDPPSPPAAFDDLPEEICRFLGGGQVTAEGRHTFYAAAMDVWGNKSAPVSREFKIDMPPPGLTSLEVTVNREQAYTGSILEYKLTVRNLTSAAQGFTVTDPIPANTEIVRRINYNPATNAVEWSGVVEPWGFKTFIVYVRIVSGTLGGTAIVNTAVLDDDGVGGGASATTIVKTLPPYRGHRADVDVNEVVVRGK